MKELFHTWEHHALNINLYVKFVRTFIFAGIQTTKL